MPKLDRPTREMALHFMREVSATDSIHGGIISPMAGSRQVRINSLSSVERFLTPVESDVVLSRGVRGSVRYVDPATLSAWIGETIGDLDLAEAIRGVTLSGRAYGVLIVDVKELIAERVSTCRDVIEQAA